MSFINLLCESEISDFEVAITCNQKVFRFQVSVRDPLTMKIVQSHNYFSSVKESHVIGEELLLPQQAEDLATLDILEDQIEVMLVLESLQTKYE